MDSKSSVLQGYSIKDLEIYTGIKAHTIRMWEKRYNLLDPERTDTNIRTYSDKQLRKLLNIATLKQAGMKISQISGLSIEEISEKVHSLRYDFTNHHFAAQINALIAEMLSFNERGFDKVFSSCVLRLGFQDTLFKVIYPLLSRIGFMWTLGEIHPAHEHFVSHIVRQKLNAATDGLIPTDRVNKRFLLFLPSKEYHELALLMANYLLRMNNHEVLYLGQSVPNNSVISTIEEWRPDYLLSSNASKPHLSKLPNWIIDLSRQLPMFKILLAGNFSDLSAKVKVPENIHLISSFEELMDKYG